MDAFPLVLPPEAVPRLAALGGVFLALLTAGLLLDVALFVRWRRLGRLPAARAWGALRARPWSGPEASALVCGWAGLNLAAGGAVALARRWFPAAGSRVAAAAVVWQTLVVPAALLLGVAALLRRRRLTWSAAFARPGAGWRTAAARGAASYLAVLPVFALAAALYLGALSRLGYPLRSQEVIGLLTDPAQPLWLQAYLCLVAVSVAPLIEETVFRGILLPALLKRFAPGAAVALVAFLFALLHFHVPSLLPIFVLAVGLALAYVWSGSLLAAIVMHALFNGFNLAAVLWLRDWFPAGP